MLIEIFSFLAFGTLNYLAYCGKFDNNMFVGTLLMCLTSFILFARYYLINSSNSLLSARNRSVKTIYLYICFTILQVVYLLLFTQFFFGFELFYKIKKLNSIVKSLVVVINIGILFTIKKYKFSIKSLICRPYVYLEILDTLLILSNLVLSILMYNNILNLRVLPIVYITLLGICIVNVIEALRRQYWICNKVYYYKLAKVVKSDSSLNTLINPPKINLLENSLFRDLSNLLDTSFIRVIEYVKVLKIFRTLLEDEGRDPLEINQLVANYSKLILQNLMRRSLDFSIWPNRCMSLLEKFHADNSKGKSYKRGLIK